MEYQEFTKILTCDFDLNKCPECSAVDVCGGDPEVITKQADPEIRFTIDSDVVADLFKKRIEAESTLRAVMSELESKIENIACCADESPALCCASNEIETKIDIRKEFVSLKDIKISAEFQRCPPASEKISRCYDFYKKYGILNRDLILDNNFTLIDGYVGYLVLKMFGIESLGVLVVDVVKI